MSYRYRPHVIAAATILVAALIVAPSISSAQGSIQQPPPQNYQPAEPSKVPQPVAPGTAFTPYNEKTPTHAIDRKSVYFAIEFEDRHAIAFFERVNNSWTDPEIAPFSGTYSDLDPMFSPDGNRLYFSSNRPIGEGAVIKDYNIWYVDKTDDGWGQPVMLSKAINKWADERYPCAVADGSIYFSASYDKAGGGKQDVFVSRFVDGAYQEAELIGDSISTAYNEFAPFVLPDERFILFSASGRDDSYGGSDIYISFRHENGTWRPAFNLGLQINTVADDYAPRISHNSSLLFLTSDRVPEEQPFELSYYTQIIQNKGKPKEGMTDMYFLDAKVWQLPPGATEGIEMPEPKGSQPKPIEP